MPDGGGAGRGGCREGGEARRGAARRATVPLPPPAPPPALRGRSTLEEAQAKLRKQERFLASRRKSLAALKAASAADASLALTQRSAQTTGTLTGGGEGEQDGAGQGQEYSALPESASVNDVLVGLTELHSEM